MAHAAHEERDRPAEGNQAGEHSSHEDDLRVRRSEEELHTGIRKREAGAVRVRKSVRTDHEEFRVPRRREEVEIERVQVEGKDREVPDAEIGADEEVVVRVYEEEIVVSKRVVLKEEIRLRKEVVEEEEIVEEDVRREEVEIDDQTERGGQIRDSGDRRDG